ncbi:hypothetical protein CH340_03115 [Rhodoplanes serenus]|nr:hypothetical protein CH340_03115 [Rhodoplanes serenus]
MVAGGQPHWVEETWTATAQELLAAGQHWRVWTDWYADVLAGRQHSEAWDACFVDLDPDDPLPWDDGPKAVNERVAARLTKLNEKLDAMVSDVPANPPEVPKPRPAAIQPVWINGRLRLPREPLPADLDPEVLVDALAALRDDLIDLAEEVLSVGNVDPRPAHYLRRVAENIPGTPPSPALLFRLGHAKEVMDRFGRTVDAEWTDLLAVRYHVVLRHFDRTVRQFPSWRAFVQNAGRGKLTPEQVAEAAKLVEPIRVELESDDARAVIDEEIPAALRELGQPIGLTADKAVALEAGMDALAVDLLESVNNVLKAVVEAALAAKARLGPIGSRAAEEYLKQADKSLVTEAGRLGDQTGPALVRLVKRLAIGGFGVAASVPALKRLSQMFPESFGWLEPVLRVLGVY